MVKTYNDPVKQKARERFREFIKANMRKSPSEMRVVCFPGAEHEGEEGIEIRQVYDKLGIPRRNIVGLEYDSENEKRLQRANLGIEVIGSDAHDFFRDTEEVFDVISLDYTGQRTWRETDVTRYIAGKQLLDRWGIYSTNHLVKREGYKMKLKLLEDSLMTDNEISHYLMEACSEPNQVIRNAMMMAYIQRHNENVGLIEKKEINLDMLRESITRENGIIMGAGISELDPSKSLFANVKYDVINTGCEAPAEFVERSNSEGLISNLEWIEEKAKNFSLRSVMASRLAKVLNISLSDASLILGIQVVDTERGYLPRNLERLIYTSNKNANMLFDMMSFKPLRYGLVQETRRLVYMDQKEGKMMINPNGISKPAFHRRIRRLIPKLIEELGYVVPLPINLGSSWVPPKRKEKITKEDAISLLKSGFEPVEIEKCYRGFTKMQLAALKAHYVTMGKKLIPK